MVDSDGEDRRYTGGKERISSINWSADGQRIFFRAKREAVSEQTQVFGIQRAGFRDRFQKRIGISFFGQRREAL